MRRSLLCLVLACSLLLASGDGGQAKTAPAPEFDTDRYLAAATAMLATMIGLPPDPGGGD